MDVLVGSILSFYQYMNRKSGQILHSGTLAGVAAALPKLAAVGKECDDGQPQLPGENTLAAH